MEEDNTIALVEMIFKTSRLMKERMSFTNSSIHLSLLQIQTMIFLDQSKNQQVTMSNIADFFNIELPSATSLLNKLCDQELVERHTDTKDRRLVIIKLTRGGKKLLEKIIQERKKKIESILSYLSKNEKLELLEIFGTLSEKLNIQNEN
jgi:DNA-binding MarR family transcriptional regulator